jgi:hypothetical protein
MLFQVGLTEHNDHVSAAMSNLVWHEGTFYISSLSGWPTTTSHGIEPYNSRGVSAPLAKCS